MYLEMMLDQLMNPKFVERKRMQERENTIVVSLKLKRAMIWPSRKKSTIKATSSGELKIQKNGNVFKEAGILEKNMELL